MQCRSSMKSSTFLFGSSISRWSLSLNEWMNIARNTGDHAASTSLCTNKRWSSTNSVTLDSSSSTMKSTKSPSIIMRHLSSAAVAGSTTKTILRDTWKDCQFYQYTNSDWRCCDVKTAWIRPRPGTPASLISICAFSKTKLEPWWKENIKERYTKKKIDITHSNVVLTHSTATLMFSKICSCSTLKQISLRWITKQ